MESVHVTPELMRALVTLELPPVVLARLVWDHLRSVCPTCRRNLDEWLQGGSYPNRFAALVAPELADADDDGEEERRRERESVARQLADLERLPAGERMGRIERATVRFQSPLLVARLIDAARSSVHDDPAEAVHYAELAHRVAERARGPRATQSRVRAAAHRGNALRAAGRLREAEPHFRKARRLLHADPVDSRTYAELDNLEGSFRRDLDDLDEAKKLLARSVLVYRIFGEREPAARALVKLAAVHRRDGELSESLSTYYEAQSLLDPELPDHRYLLAHVCLNLAFCLAYSGETADADQVLAESAELLEEVDEATFRLRRAWAEGLVAAGLGKLERGVERLRHAASGFGRLGIGYDAALVLLDLAEVHHARGDHERVQRLARSVTPLLSANDLHREAVAALSLFRDAAAHSLVTRTLIAQVRGRLEASRRHG